MPNKAVAAGLAGALTIIIAWVMSQFFHITLPPEVATAFTTVLSTGAAYFTPHEGQGT